MRGFYAREILCVDYELISTKVIKSFNNFKLKFINKLKFVN